MASDRSVGGTDHKDVNASRGKRVYLAAHELHQLRADMMAMQESDKDAPEAVILRRNDIVEKIGGVNKRPVDTATDREGPQ